MAERIMGTILMASESPAPSDDGGGVLGDHDLTGIAQDRSLASPSAPCSAGWK